MIKILAVSGSLRRASVNSAVLHAASVLAPATIVVSICDALADIPLFNPDIEASNPPAVLRLRSQLKSADGLMIASPEYAHGVAGVIKNALDWIVGSGELEAKPIALLNTSIRAVHAYAALEETLKTMGGRIVPEASLKVPLPSNTIDQAGILASAELKGWIQDSITALELAIKSAQNLALSGAV
jgi:chromate reductase, NAD(P)H dehydrogenase (quinone)